MSTGITSWVHLEPWLLDYLLAGSEFDEYETNGKLWNPKTRGLIVNPHWEKPFMVVGPREGLGQGFCGCINALPDSRGFVLVHDKKINLYEYNSALHRFISTFVYTAYTCLDDTSLTFEKEVSTRKTIDFYVDVPGTETGKGGKLFHNNLSYRIRLYFTDDLCDSLRVIISPFDDYKSQQARGWNLSEHNPEYDGDLDALLEQEKWNSELIYCQRADLTEGEEPYSEINFLWNRILSKLLQYNAEIVGCVCKERYYWQPFPWGHEGENSFQEEHLSQQAPKDEPPIITMTNSWGRIIIDLCYIYHNGLFSCESVLGNKLPQAGFQEFNGLVQKLYTRETPPDTYINIEFETSYNSKAIGGMVEACKSIYSALEKNEIGIFPRSTRKYHLYFSGNAETI
ncbi:hypothetical protein JXB41_05685 [Candidatus Woesearchaeota archaeon]|nr:hypothetical protein [Candidatus Woesearchaeota archaeon]